jgi:mevalonate kinase
MQLKASAPGSLMLLGEHAVLHGKPALVCAVDKRLSVTLTPRDDKQLQITSALGHYSSSLNDLVITKPFQFVLAAVKYFQDQLQYGCDITIESEFSDQLGLGSSAAVTVATLSAFSNWLDIRLTDLELIRLGRDIVRSIQGLGSGADIAASVLGGVVSYQSDPVMAEKIAVNLPLHAIYAGYKTPTVEVIQHVREQFVNQPDLFKQICHEIGECSVDGLSSVKNENVVDLGRIMNAQQTLMESLGVCTPLLNDMIKNLCQQPGIHGAKISGSGLGDCVIALGKLPANYECIVDGKKLQRVPVNMTLRGVQCEKI